jgi:hypothetical protein
MLARDGLKTENQTLNRTAAFGMSRLRGIRF